MPESLLKSIRDSTPAEMVKEIFRTDGERLLKFPVPQVIKGETHTAIYKFCSGFISKILESMFLCILLSLIVSIFPIWSRGQDCMEHR